MNSIKSKITPLGVQANQKSKRRLGIINIIRSIFRMFVFVPVVLLVLTSFFVVAPARASTGINKQINFQGKLVDNNGLNVADSTYSVVFTLYDASSNGTTLWTETDSVTTFAGIFQVSLGANTSFANVNFNSDNLYLGVKVGSDPEMTPRIRFTAVPYAFNASKLNGVTATQSATGFTLEGGTSTQSSLSFTTSGGILTFQPGVAGALAIQSNGSAGLTLDTGGSAALTVGALNATSLVFGNSTSNPSFSFAGTGGLTIANGGNSNITLGSNAGNGTVVIQPNAGGQAALILNKQGGNDIFTASSGGTTRFTIASDGTITDASYAGNNAVLYGAVTTGIFSKAVTSTVNQCLVSGAGGTNTPGWSTCALGVNNWTLDTTNGLLYPGNLTNDFVFGGSSTSSATFHLYGSGVPQAGTNPVASVSGNTSRSAVVIDNKGSGDLFSASSSGLNRFVIKQNGNIGIGTNVPATKLQISETGTNVANYLLMDANSGDTGTLFSETNNFSQLQGGLIYNAGGNTLDLRTGSGVDVGSLTTRLSIERDTGNVAIGNTSFAQKFRISDNSGGTDTYALIDTAGLSSGVLFSEDNASNYEAGIIYDGTNNRLDLRTGTSTVGNLATRLSIARDTGSVGIGTVLPLAALDVRGTSATTPIASVSGLSTFAGFVVDNKGSGDLFSASSSGLNRFVIKQNGKVGIGISTPNHLLEISGDGSGADWTDALGGILKLNSANGVGTGITLNNTSAGGQMFSFVSTGTGALGGAGGINLFNNTLGTVALRIDRDGKFGIGSNNVFPLAAMDVRGITSHQPIASFSGSTSTAGFFVDNTGSGDLFTASKAGVPTFTIGNTGIITGSNYRTAGGVLYANTTGQFLQTAQGSTNQCLLSAGANAPVWSTCSLGINDWTYDSVNGVVYPGNLTTDLLIGGTSTSSARFHMYGSVNSATTPAASVSASSTFAGFVVDNKGSGDLFTASKAGVPTFTITNTGQIITSNYQLNGGIFYADSTGKFIQLQGGSNTLLHGNGNAAPTFSAVNLGSADVTGILQPANGGSVFYQNLGANIAGNSTMDLLIGGTSTQSARFHAYGSVNAGTTPAASVAAASTFASMIVDNTGSGALFTASKSGASKFTINSNGTIDLDTTNYGNCGLLATDVNGGITCGPGGGSETQMSTQSLPETTLAATSTLISTVSITPNTTTGDVWVMANLWTKSLSNTDQTLTFELRSGSDCTGTIRDSETAALTSANASNGPSGFLAYMALNPGTSSQTYAICGKSTAASGASAGGLATATALNIVGPKGDTGGDTLWQLIPSTGLLAPTSITTDLLIGGTATLSARAGFLNINSGNPIATLSAGIAGGAYLTADGNLATTANQTLILGGSTTGNILINHLGGNYTGIGTNNPLASLDIHAAVGLNGGTLPVASISGKTSNAGFVIDNSGRGDLFTASSSGVTQFVIKNGGQVGIGTSLPLTALDIRGDANVTASISAALGGAFLTGAGNLATTNNQTLILGGSTTGNILINHLGGNYTGIGTNDPRASLDIRSATSLNGGTIPVASVSGKTSSASLVVVNNGNGDLFTASSGGQTRFTIAQNGNVTINGDTLGFATNSALMANNGSQSFVNALPDSGSLVPNGGFEASNSAGFGFADGWVKSATSSGAVSLDTSTAAQGNNSVKVQLGAAGSAAFESACVPLALSVNTYTLSWQVKPNAATNNSTVRAYVDGYTSKANCAINAPSAAPIALGATVTVGGTAWLFTNQNGNTATGNYGANTTWGRVRFFIANANAGTVNIDSVRLVTQNANQGLDYAENYPADPGNIALPGQIVSFAQKLGSTIVVLATSQDNAIGVVSTQPGQVLDDGFVPSPKVAIALAGRVPVKVSTKNGPIHVGDHIAASDIPGVGVKAIQPGFVLGVAMEDYENVDPTATGEIITFINRTWFDTESSLVSVNDFEFHVSTSSSISSSGSGSAVLRPFYSLTDAAQNTVSRVGAFAEAAIGNIKAGGIVAQEITVTGLLSVPERIAAGAVEAKQISTDALIVTTENITIGGQTLRDYIQQAVKDALTSQVTQLVSMHGLVTDASSSALLNQIVNENVTLATSSAFSGITFDKEGNGFISGTLTVDTLKANHIAGLEVLVGSIVGEILGISASVEATPSIDPTVSYSTASASVPVNYAPTLTLSSLTVDGLATVSADLRVKGNSLIEGVLTVIDTLRATNLISTGLSDFFGVVNFRNDVFFMGRPTFNNDTAGFAVIKKGATYVDISFTKEYQQTPVVNANIVLDQPTKSPSQTDEAYSKLQDEDESEVLSHETRYIITRKTEHGFRIILDNPAASDLTFSWIAVAVDKPVKVESKTTPTPAPTISPIQSLGKEEKSMNSP